MPILTSLNDIIVLMQSAKKGFFKTHKTKLIPLLTFVVTLSVIFYIIVSDEKQKAYQKNLLLKSYYIDNYNNWLAYKGEYFTQVDILREENLKRMDESKKQYEDLLVQQPNLITQHTKSVLDTEATNLAQYSLSNSSASSTKQVITVSKPKSAPKTSAS